MKNKKYLIVISILSLIFIINTVLVLLGKTTGFDNAVYNLVRSLEGDFCDKYFVFITKFGNVSVVIGVVAFIALIVFAIVKVFPEPVTPKSVCIRSPRATPATSASIACG